MYDVRKQMPIQGRSFMTSLIKKCFVIMGMLVVYCLRSISFAAFPFGIPELLACAVVVALHLWKRNTLLSIAGGTVFYMLLVQLVF